MTDDEHEWLEKHFARARDLLKKPEFETGVHSIASYRWNPHPRAQLAVLWSGIEGLFGVDSELVFRLSLYAARFLAPSDEPERSRIFAGVKHLYKKRSAAVHGSEIKGDHEADVHASAELLLRLLRECVNRNDVPRIEDLAP